MSLTTPSAIVERLAAALPSPTPPPKCPLACWPSARRLVVESVKGRREIAAEDYFKGLYETARAANELLVEISDPCCRKIRGRLGLSGAGATAWRFCHGWSGLCRARVKPKTFEELAPGLFRQRRQADIRGRAPSPPWSANPGPPTAKRLPQTL